MSISLSNTKYIIATALYLNLSNYTTENITDIIGGIEGGLTPDQIQTTSAISTAIRMIAFFLQWSRLLFFVMQNQINNKINISDSYSQTETHHSITPQLHISDFNSTNTTNLTNQHSINFSKLHISDYTST